MAVISKDIRPILILTIGMYFWVKEKKFVVRLCSDSLGKLLLTSETEMGTITKEYDHQSNEKSSQNMKKESVQNTSFDEIWSFYQSCNFQDVDFMMRFLLVISNDRNILTILLKCFDDENMFKLCSTVKVYSEYFLFQKERSIHNVFFIKK